MGAIVLGLVAGVVCFFFCTAIKNALGYDDSLDVFGVHCIGGIIGAIGTGILVSPALRRHRHPRLHVEARRRPSPSYDMIAQVIVAGQGRRRHLAVVGHRLAILFKLVDVIVGLRPATEQEREGLDLTDHGERAYNY